MLWYKCLHVFSYNYRWMVFDPCCLIISLLIYYTRLSTVVSYDFFLLLLLNPTLKLSSLFITAFFFFYNVISQTRLCLNKYAHTHNHITLSQNNTCVICLTRASTGYASPKMPCQLMPERKKPSEVNIAATLITMLPLGPWGIMIKSEPSSPCQSPWVYLTDTDLPLVLYVLELKGIL